MSLFTPKGFCIQACVDKISGNGIIVQNAFELDGFMDSIKREYPRKQKKIKAMISIHIEESDGATLSLITRDKGVRLMAETKDISWGGFCLRFEDLPSDPENRFSPSRAHKLVEQAIKVTLSKPALTLWGEVIRFDTRTQEMAVIITKVSDYERWQNLCNQGNEAD